MQEIRELLHLIDTELEPAGVHCLLIGGFAVNYYGYTRNTLDVDFMIVAEHLQVAKGCLQKAGFSNFSQHSNVSFFNRPGSNLRVDFLMVEAATMAKLLANAVFTEVYGVKVRLPALQDLLAMKLFSLGQNSAQRMGKDLPDIVYLTLVNQVDVEAILKPLALRYATADLFEMVAAQIRSLQA